MSITFSCPDCSHRLAARDEHVGKTVKCPNCGQLIRVPAVSETIESAEKSQPPPDNPHASPLSGSPNRSDPAHPLWPSAPADLSLPQHFFMLDSVRRKEALDLAWGIRPAKIPVPPKPPSPRFSGLLVVGVILLIYGLSFLLLAIPCFTSQLGVYGQDGKDVNTIQTERQTQQERSFAIGFSVLLGVCGLVMAGTGIVCMKRGAKQAAASKALFQQKMRTHQSTLPYFQQLQAYVLRLQELGVTFVRESYESWRKGMAAQGEAKARSEAAVSEKFASFVVYSTEATIPKSGMPDPWLQVMYIFSNSFISLVSNVILDTRSTSYSLVNSDQPSWRVHTDQINLDEFHYRDIVEVEYNLLPPAPPISASPGVSAPPVNAKPSTTPIRKAEGELCITLVAGTRKTYPSTRSGVSSFMRTAREKMREAKKER